MTIIDGEIHWLKSKIEELEEKLEAAETFLYEAETDRDYYKGEYERAERELERLGAGEYAEKHYVRK